MGHIHADSVEDAWRDLSKATMLATNQQEHGALNIIRLIFRNVRSTVESVETSRRNLTKNEGNIKDRLFKIERQGLEPSTEDVLDLLEAVRDYIHELAQRTHEWFNKNMPDYNYGIHLKSSLDGIQLLDDR